MGFTCTKLTNIFPVGRYWDFKIPSSPQLLLFFNLPQAFDISLSDIGSSS